MWQLFFCENKKIRLAFNENWNVNFKYVVSHMVWYNAHVNAHIEIEVLSLWNQHLEKDDKNNWKSFIL